LVLDDKNIGNTEMKEIAKELASNTKLLVLQLSGNSLGLEASMLMVDALKMMCLSLNRCDIGRYGAAILAKALKKNTSLQLELDGNNICSYGAMAISNSLKQNTTLKTLLGLT
jgi:Leucine Rich repeat